jgi:hypothetical protein
VFWMVVFMIISQVLKAVLEPLTTKIGLAVAWAEVYGAKG